MSQQNNLDLAVESQPNQDRFEFEPIKGYPMLNWRGKRPFTSTSYYPAQLKEQHGASVDGVSAEGKPINNWLNKIFWGDNLQVMAHLLKDFRSKIDLIYIDPPFDSKAEYKKKIKLLGTNEITNDQSVFEEKQYSDIWSNDEYLQFIYERICLCKELLSDTGVLFIHIDQRLSHYIRCILDEIFGAENFRNEIIWHYGQRTAKREKKFDSKHDNIMLYAKSDLAKLEETTIHWEYEEFVAHRHDLIKDENGEEYVLSDAGNGSRYRRYVKDILAAGKPLDTVWNLPILNSSDKQRTGYPTQKPDYLIERIIKAGSKKNHIVFDCFMGSGTTQAVAMKLGRRFIGADINLGAIQTTTKRLIKVARELEAKVSIPEVIQQQLPMDSDQENNESKQLLTYYTGFEVYNVNHYDVFRNPVQAKELLIEALGIQKIPNSIYDGEKDGRMVKIMPINRIATRADLGDLVSGVDYKAFEKIRDENPNKPVAKILLVCMGHEPDLAASLKQEIGFKLDIEIVDILRDKTDLQFKRDSEARLAVKDNQLIIERFYPMNLMQKISQTKESVDEWREMVESIMVDWNYDGVLFQPSVTDIPNKNELVIGQYSIPEDAGTIRVKITDLLSESWEGEING